MADDYSDEDEFSGFSDHEEQHFVYDISDDISDDSNHDRGMFNTDEQEAASDGDDQPKDYTTFFDDEASEAESELSSETAFGDIDNALDLQAFTNFMKLPTELREMIWKSYCPDLSAKPRVYEVHFDSDGKTIQFAAHVEGQTASLRTVLAIHGETRHLGLQFAPNLIELPHGLGTVPCHLERDIVFVETACVDPTRSSQWVLLARYAPGIQNLAIFELSWENLNDSFQDHWPRFSLQNIFISQDVHLVSSKGLSWCASNHSLEYHVVHMEDMGIGYQEPIEITYVWPQHTKDGIFSEHDFSGRQFGALSFDEDNRVVDPEGDPVHDHPREPTDREVGACAWGLCIGRCRGQVFVPLEPDEGSSASEPDPATSDEDEHVQKHQQKAAPQPPKISVWPIARFMFESGMERLDELRAWEKPWDEWVSDEDESEDDDDDSDLDSDDSLNDFIAGDETIEVEDGDDSEDEDASSADELSLHPSGPTIIDLVDSSDEGGASAVPSNLAPSGRRVRQGRALAVESEDEAEDENATPQPSRADMRRARYAALRDSEDEDDSDSRNSSGSAARRGRPATLIESEDEDEDEDENEGPQPSRSTARRSRHAALSESEDEDEDENSKPSRNTARHGRPATLIESEDEGEDEDEGPRPSRSTAGRSRHAALSESEDESDNDAPPPSRTKARRGRPAAVSESENDEQDIGDLPEDDMQASLSSLVEDSDAPQPSRTKTRRGRPAAVSDSEDDNDDEQDIGDLAEDDMQASLSSLDEDSLSSDDDDDDPPPAPKISLAKRLRLEAAAARAALDSEESDGDGYGNGRGLDEEEEDDMAEEEGDEDGDDDRW